MEALLTTKDLTKRWNCSIDTVYRHIKKGLKVIYLGTKDYRYDIKDVVEYENHLKAKSYECISVNLSLDGKLLKDRCLEKI